MFPQIFWAVFVSEVCNTNNVDNNRGLFGGGPPASYRARPTARVLPHVFKRAHGAKAMPADKYPSLFDKA